jgi:hypothetical protein
LCTSFQSGIWVTLDYMLLRDKKSCPVSLLRFRAPVVNYDLVQQTSLASTEYADGVG